MTAPAITPGAIPVAERRVSGGLWSDAGRRLMRNKPAVFGLACIMLFVFVALFAPVIAPYGPLERPGKSLEPPSPEFIMGTDLQGRDQYSRILYGAQISLQVGVVAVIMALFFGVIIGAAAGGLGGKVDAVLMRSTDVLLSIPGFLFAITIVVLLGFGIVQAAVAVGLTMTATFARLIRAEVVKARTSAYVEAATTSGASTADILRRHVVPNSIAPTLSIITVQFGIAIIWIASLSFLGLGAQPPDPEWGRLVSDGRNYIATRGWLTLWPGLTVVVVVLATNHISHHLSRRDKS